MVPRITTTASPDKTTLWRESSTRQVRSPPRAEHCRAVIIVLPAGETLEPPEVAVGEGRRASQKGANAECADPVTWSSGIPILDDMNICKMIEIPVRQSLQKINMHYTY